MIKITQSGNFNKMDRFLNFATKMDVRSTLHEYGAQGVKLLRESTPVNTGKTAASWDYSISINRKRIMITWTNSNINQGVPIAILIQYGHGLRSGGYVEGIDYINPALKPVFEEMADAVWKKVTGE